MPTTAILIVTAIVIVVIFALRKGYGVQAKFALNFEPKDKSPKT